MTATRPRPRRQRIGQDVEGRRDRVLPGRAPPSRDDASILAWTASSATEALGRVIRAAEWMGAGDRRQLHRAEPVTSPQPTAGSGAAKEENGRGAPSLAAESPPSRRRVAGRAADGVAGPARAGRTPPSSCASPSTPPKHRSSTPTPSRSWPDPANAPRSSCRSTRPARGPGSCSRSRSPTGRPPATRTPSRLRAGLPAAGDEYDPGPGALVVSGDDDTPARVRFRVAVDIPGHCLSTADRQAALVEPRRAVQHEPRRGRPCPPPGPRRPTRW